MKTRRELKKQSKDLLRGNWLQGILLNLIPTIIQLVLIAAFIVALGWMGFNFNDVKESISHAADYSTNGGNNGGNMIGSIVSTVFLVGIQYTFLDWVRNRDYEVHPLRDAFQVFSQPYFWGTIGLFFIQMIYVWLWSILFIIPGIVKSYAYKQSYFVYKDRRDVSGDAPVSFLGSITESRALMYGHKIDYFVLQLSFLGWDILSVITFGIGFLWLNPYKNATYAGYYDELKRARDEQIKTEPKVIEH
ncbi:DUF975 family protein [Loigolactobacillus iwatensis]|uniref:DUF975 family protein n=1 Tax=Loigolactobacillus iwatensis TaxID=1267156 RepID=UPI000F7D632D|nr:DUF975 family protein [Loigolactobacillus iwatensis]